MSDIENELGDLETPDGIMAGALIGWPTLNQITGNAAGEPPRVKLGTLEFPQSFQMWIASTDDPETTGWAVALFFTIDESAQEVILTGAFSGSLEAHDAIDRIRSVRSIAWWKRKGLMQLAINEGERQLAEIRGFDFESMTPEQQIDDYAGAKEIASRIRAVTAIPLSRRRDRVTGNLLSEVASVYRSAWEAGLNPTEAVAKQFHKSHSTAARWVGLARKSGDLGASDGSRGGEVRA